MSRARYSSQSDSRSRMTCQRPATPFEADKVKQPVFNLILFHLLVPGGRWHTGLSAAFSSVIPRRIVPPDNPPATGAAVVPPNPSTTASAAATSRRERSSSTPSNCMRRPLRSDGMGVKQHASRPSPRVSQESYLRRGLCMIPLPCLDDLRPVFLEQPRGTMRRPDNRDVPRPVGVRTFVNDHHKVSPVRQRLRLVGVQQSPPSTPPAVRGTEPLSLCVGKQDLPVFRRPQHVYAQPLPNCRGECAAMCRPARSSVVRPPVGFTRLPVHVFTRQPQRLYIHGVQHGQEMSALFRDRSTTRRFRA